MVMMAILKGKPLINMAGERTAESKKEIALLPSVPLKSAISTVPTSVVVTQVAANRTTLIQGNGRASSSAKTSTGRENKLSMKRLDGQLQRLQVFAGLEPHSFTGRDVHFRTRSRIAPDPGFARLYGEYAEATQLNPIVGLEGIFHTVE